MWHAVCLVCRLLTLKGDSFIDHPRSSVVRLTPQAVIASAELRYDEWTRVILTPANGPVEGNVGGLVSDY